MSLDEDLADCCEDTGFVVMVLITFIALPIGIIAALEYGRSREQIQRCPSPEIKIENVIGDERPDKFYYDNEGRRMYLEIDGQPSQQYFRNLEKLNNK